MHKRRDRSITPFFYLYRAVRTMLISAVIIFAKTVLHQIIIWPAEQRRQSEHQNKHEHGLGEGKDIGQHVLLGCVKCRR